MTNGAKMIWTASYSAAFLNLLNTGFRPEMNGLSIDLQRKAFEERCSILAIAHATLALTTLRELTEVEVRRETGTEAAVYRFEVLAE
jgi:hypothetical protein